MGKAATATYQWFQRLAACARNGSAEKKTTFTNLHIDTANNTSGMALGCAIATRDCQLHVCTKCASRSPFQAKIRGRNEFNFAQRCNGATRTITDSCAEAMANNHCDK